MSYFRQLQASVWDCILSSEDDVALFQVEKHRISTTYLIYCISRYVKDRNHNDRCTEHLLASSLCSPPYLFSYAQVNYSSILATLCTDRLWLRSNEVHRLRYTHQDRGSIDRGVRSAQLTAHVLSGPRCILSLTIDQDRIWRPMVGGTWHFHPRTFLCAKHLYRWSMPTHGHKHLRGFRNRGFCHK